MSPSSCDEMPTSSSSAGVVFAKAIICQGAKIEFGTLEFCSGGAEVPKVWMPRREREGQDLEASVLPSEHLEEMDHQTCCLIFFDYVCLLHVHTAAAGTVCELHMSPRLFFGTVQKLSCHPRLQKSPKNLTACPKRGPL